MGENHFDALPTATYGMVMLCAAIAYYILQSTIHPRAGSALDARGGGRE